jgi:argininosuccinate lyase
MARFCAAFAECQPENALHREGPLAICALKMSKKNSPVSRSGRFAGGPEAEVARFTESISFDWRLWEQDIRGSKAHARMLRKIGILTAAELRGIVAGLDEIAEEIRSGKFKWSEALEDVHMNIEAELTRRCPAGAKLHTGRSRNDQVAVDVRLWLRDQSAELEEELRELQRAFLDLAGRHCSVIIPGYTHLQRAQPVYFAHHMLAYVEMFERDRARFADSRERMNVCPLGSGAIAGSTLPLDRAFVAAELGFVDSKGNPRISQNSMDAVSDRDFALEFCGAAAIAAVHLSRLAEDLVLWASSEFNFVRIADAYTTGSSLMPQKKNPDIAELARGKSARVIGDLVALLTLVKGLPMTYNRDLQEDKERLFDAAGTVRATVRIVAAMLRNTTVNAQACERAASDSALLATDLADDLVLRGMPFRQAHHAVGAAVALAEKKGKALHELTSAEFQSVEPRFGSEAASVLQLRKAMDKRNLPGAPGPKEVAGQIARWKKLLA